MRYLAPLLFGLVGVGILASLGFWQVDRLAWKEAALAEISARMTDLPVPVPSTPDPATDTYLAVAVRGTIGTDFVRVLVSQKTRGAGYRIISPLVLEGGRIILLDRGFETVAAGPAPVHSTPVAITGNLHWPDEIDSFTPEPDEAANIWFARDVPMLAQRLGTEPVLLIARTLSVDDTPVSPLPVDTSGIPNDHLGYAVTWFGLALVWFGMTAFLLWRMARRAV
ncbi:MAG: surfeit locus 1 family protein [Paracoccaceae bacterium]|jgi:surfeit locus 1 family protein